MPTKALLCGENTGTVLTSIIYSALVIYTTPLDTFKFSDVSKHYSEGNITIKIKLLSKLTRYALENVKFVAYRMSSTRIADLFYLLFFFYTPYVE